MALIPVRIGLLYAFGAAGLGTLTILRLPETLYEK
jgi:hypothetical protein